MDKKAFTEALQHVRSATKKRKFTQTVDLIINLKGLDLKKEDQRVLSFVKLPFTRGKKVRVTALVDKELSTKAKEVCDTVILKDEFPTADKKFIKQLTSKTDFFVAQANIMPDVAKRFGRVLGTRGLMPNPKAGCVLPPTAEVKPIVENLQKTVKVETKGEKVIKVAIGTESMKDEEIVDNAFAVYNGVLHLLPQEANNIHNTLLKVTMGKPFVVGEKQKPEAPKKEEKKEQPKEKPAPKPKTEKKAEKKEKAPKAEKETKE